MAEHCQIVGSGTAAASSRDAALWRSNRVPAFTSATPAFRNVSTVTVHRRVIVEPGVVGYRTQE